MTYSPFDLHSGVPVDEKLFSERLKPAGYKTGAFGKWHAGASAPFHPNNRGFDYFYGFLSGGHDYFPHLVTTTYPLISPNGKPHYSANEGCFLPLSRNDKAGEFTEYLTTALSRDGAKFIKEAKEPFLVYMAYNAPHAPLHAKRDNCKIFAHQNPQRRAYAAMIDKMDEGIGMLVDALEESGNSIIL